MLAVLLAAGGAAAAAGEGPVTTAGSEVVARPTPVVVDETWDEWLRHWIETIQSIIDSQIPVAARANEAIATVCDLYNARGWPVDMTDEERAAALMAIANLHRLMDQPDWSRVDGAHVLQMKNALSSMESTLPR